MRESPVPSPGIPGLRGTDHIGFTVPDLEQATRFFVDVIGCTYVHSLGPISDDTDWMAKHLNVHPRARVREIRFFRCRQGSNFELFEYAAPDQKREPPRNSDVGGHHLAFYVDDMDAALTHLRAHDVRILGSACLSAARIAPARNPGRGAKAHVVGIRACLPAFR